MPTRCSLQTGRDSARPLRLIVTIDIVFPLAMLAFLLVFARFAAPRAGLPVWASRLLALPPLLYFGLDLLENASVLAMQTPKEVDEVLVQSTSGSPSRRTLTGQASRDDRSVMPCANEKASIASGHIMAMRSSAVGGLGDSAVDFA